VCQLTLDTGLGGACFQRLAEEVERQSRGAVPDADVVINANPDPLHCARELGRLLGDARFQRFIQVEFQPRTTTPHDVLYRIANLPFAHFLTFNFDTSNERVHEAVGRPCASVTTANDGGAPDPSEINASVAPSRPSSLYLSGKWLYRATLSRSAGTCTSSWLLTHKAEAPLCKLTPL
jgi:hypothetical protein